MSRYEIVNVRFIENAPALDTYLSLTCTPFSSMFISYLISISPDKQPSEASMPLKIPPICRGTSEKKPFLHEAERNRAILEQDKCKQNLIRSAKCFNDTRCSSSSSSVRYSSNHLNVSYSMKDTPIIRINLCQRDDDRDQTILWFIKQETDRTLRSLILDAEYL